MKFKIFNKKTKRLALMLSLAGLDGSVALAALQGFFKVENFAFLALLFMVGPGALITASYLDGPVRERMFSALLAGTFATLIIVFAAGIGPKLLQFVNVNIIRIVGAFAIGAIALLIAGIKIPENSPFIIMLIGLIASLIWR
ncbi:hypothetical protein HYW75_06415 [Candidatus Pacearchaeota archaeon]|nr:hypothetical protein [Candidatus Pacearchaeota archaeon]